MDQVLYHTLSCHDYSLSILDNEDFSDCNWI